MGHRVVMQQFEIKDILPGDDVYQRINGCSFQENPHVSLKDLCYLTMPYHGFDGKAHVGEMIVNKAIAEDVLDIFQNLYRSKYPIERMQLVDDFGGDDNASMASNNSSAFNYRCIAGTTKLSNHSYGLAIDINPIYNPYIYTSSDGVFHVDPAGSEPYVDRTGRHPYQIDHQDLCYQQFVQHGFTWGGDWNHAKDYQHFEKSLTNAR